MVWALHDAWDLLLGAPDGLVTVLKRRAVEHRGTAMVGRTHGIHAEPTTFGAKLALWALQADRDRAAPAGGPWRSRRRQAERAVGTYSNIDPAVERHVCAALGLHAGAGDAGHRP